MDYASSSTEGFNLEVIESLGAKNEDDCDTTLSNECEITDINLSRGSDVSNFIKSDQKIAPYHLAFFRK